MRCETQKQEAVHRVCVCLPETALPWRTLCTGVPSRLVCQGHGRLQQHTQMNADRITESSEDMRTRSMCTVMFHNWSSSFLWCSRSQAMPKLATPSCLTSRCAQRSSWFIKSKRGMKAGMPDLLSKVARAWQQCCLARLRRQAGRARARPPCTRWCWATDIVWRISYRLALL